MKTGTGCALLTILLLMGCAGAEVAPDAAELGVAFSWAGVKKCSKISPELQVVGIPDGAVTLAVTLKDLDVPRWNHGGGRVPHDGSGIVPAGALTNGYNGPCPPSGSHRYQFTVRALNREGVVVGMGKSMATYP
jgi:phosphatidylethanolamine-binding protein (PEBP) family uncharacterized protein